MDTNPISADAIKQATYMELRARALRPYYENTVLGFLTRVRHAKMILANQAMAFRIIPEELPK